MAINVDISKITGINQVGNSYQRKSAVPLDYYSLFNTKAEAEAYAASNPVSYVGQVISYIDNGEVKVCVIANADGLLREVGTKPVGDGKTIEVSDEGAVALLGAASAANGTLPMIEEVEGEQKLVWKTLEDIGAGDGNDNTTYAFSFADQKITITPSFNGVAQTPVELDLSVFATEDEMAAAIQEAIEALPEDKDTTYTLSLSGMELSLTPSEGEAQKVTIDAYSKSEADEKVKVAKDRADEAYTLASGKVDISAYNEKISNLEAEDTAIRAIAESAYNSINAFLTSEKIDETVDTLKELQAEIEKMTDATELTNALANKADVSALNEVDSKFANYTTTENLEDLLDAKQDVIPENTYDAYGAATSAQAAAEAKAAELAGTAKSEAIADADGKLALKADASAVYTKAEADNLLSAKANAADVYAKSETYTQAQVDALLDGIQAGSSESAASVNTKLEALKKTLNNEIYGNDEGTGDSRIDAAEAKLAGIAEGAQVNVIESVSGVDGNRIAVSTSGKTVSIDDSGLRVDIADAKAAGTNAGNVASQAVQAAGENANKIQANTTAIEGLTTLTSGHTTDIANLKLADSAHDAEFETLNASVSSHGTKIATLEGSKADKSALDGVSAKVTANEEALKTLNETTVPAINAAIAKKADATALESYYTKSEVNGEVAKLEQAISDAKAEATYDDTNVLALIAANTKAIEDEASRADTAEKANGVLIAENAADIAANALLIKDNTDAIAKNAAAIKLLTEGVEPDVVDGVNDLIAYVVEHGAEVTGMKSDISENAAGIAAIYSVAEDGTKSGVLVSEIARVEGLVSTNSSLIAAINDENTGILATAKKYTDDAIAGLPAATAEALGLVKYDDVTVKMNENKQLYVAKVSTDILEQGENTLVLNGGSAVL